MTWVTLRDLDSRRLEWEGPLDDLIEANGRDLLGADEVLRVLNGEAVIVHWSVVQREDPRDRGLSRGPGCTAALDLLRREGAPVVLLWPRGSAIGVWRLEAVVVREHAGRIRMTVSRPVGGTQLMGAAFAAPRRVVVLASRTSARQPHLWMYYAVGRVEIGRSTMQIDGRYVLDVVVAAPPGGHLRTSRRILTYEGGPRV